MSRPAAYPDRRSGVTTFTLSTDTHLGEFDFVSGFVDRAGADLDSLAQFVDGHVHTGDCIHWAVNDSPEDPQFKAWMAARRANTTRPWVVAPGNHDLASFTDPSPWRTKEDWAAATGEPNVPVAQTIGGVRILAVGPDTWKDEPWGNMVLSASTLSWIDSQLSAHPEPTFLATHSPIDEQYDDSVYCEPAAEITNLIGSHENLVGVLSGHLHTAFRTRPQHAAIISVAGRRIFGLNGPATGGRMNGVTYGNHQWKSPVVSMVASFDDDVLTVRWRNHLERRWDVCNGSRVVVLDRR